MLFAFLCGVLMIVGIIYTGGGFGVEIKDNAARILYGIIIILGATYLGFCVFYDDISNWIARRLDAARSRSTPKQ